MKAWHLAAIGVGGVIAFHLLKRSGALGLGADAQIPPPNAPWWNMGVKPMPYMHTGWQPTNAWMKVADRPPLGEFDSTYPVALSPYAMPYLPVETDPIDWMTPQIDQIHIDPQVDAF